MSTRSLSSTSNNRNKSITRNTTCSNLFDSDELEFCCNNYKPKVQILSLRRKLKKQSNKDNYLSNKYRQP